MLYSFNFKTIIGITDFINVSRVIGDITSKLIYKGVKKWI